MEGPLAFKDGHESQSNSTHRLNDNVDVSKPIRDFLAVMNGCELTYGPVVPIWERSKPDPKPNLILYVWCATSFASWFYAKFKLCLRSLLGKPFRRSDTRSCPGFGCLRSLTSGRMRYRLTSWWQTLSPKSSSDELEEVARVYQVIGDATRERGLSEE